MIEKTEALWGKKTFLVEDSHYLPQRAGLALRRCFSKLRFRICNMSEIFQYMRYSIWNMLQKTRALLILKSKTLCPLWGSPWSLCSLEIPLWLTPSLVDSYPHSSSACQYFRVLEHSLHSWTLSSAPEFAAPQGL